VIRPVRILGLDPGLRRTGWGVIACEGARITHVAHGVISPDPDADFAERLLALFQGVEAVIAAHAPNEAAVEETFINSNAQSALKVVKKAVVGTGGADKTQVAWMIARLLPTAGKTSADAADALAVAIAHAHARTARRVA
jgi:crossover junction endodeoxyribonuclease RuvC